MMPPKIVSMTVVASENSSLCFETSGILGNLRAQLGDYVSVMDFDAFYAALRAFPTSPGNAARLLYDDTAIQNFVQKYTLAALRAETNKANLRKAINTRESAYYAKYTNQTGIIAKMNDFFSPMKPYSKANHLKRLVQLSKENMAGLRDAYILDGRAGVIKETTSVLILDLFSQSQTSELGKMNEESAAISMDPADDGVTFPPLAPGGAQLITTAPAGKGTDTVQDGTSSQNSTSTGTGRQKEAIANKDYGYRIPYLENLAQYERSQISLIDEEFSQFMYEQSLPYLAEIFKNELDSIDSSVFQMQVAYLSTILLSPIRGIVTGIYKHPGDPVQAGEPVIRVENIDHIFLVATIIWRAPVTLGSTLTVSTSLFDEGGLPTPFSGKVVAVRGSSDDEQWDVTVKCDNRDASGVPIFPPGYQFDNKDTSLSFS
jgi:hypothetical protein